MATHSSVLAWEIPWTEEAGRLQSMGPQRVTCNLASEQQQKALILHHKINLKKFVLSTSETYLHLLILKNPKQNLFL